MNSQENKSDTFHFLTLLALQNSNKVTKTSVKFLAWKAGVVIHHDTGSSCWQDKSSVIIFNSRRAFFCNTKNTDNFLDTSTTSITENSNNI